MIEFLTSDCLLRILAKLLMAEILIGLGISFFVVVAIILASLWRVSKQW